MAALRKIQEMYGRIPSPCGIFLSADGLLGASPDGVLDDGAIVEVKCPYSWRHLPNFDSVIGTADSFLVTDESGLKLKEAHPYCH